eukprot:9052958-Pyramimonas_sp.AAC.1
MHHERWALRVDVGASLRESLRADVVVGLTFQTFSKSERASDRKIKGDRTSKPFEFDNTAQHR